MPTHILVARMYKAYVINMPCRLAREYALENSHPYTDHLRRIQCILQDINSYLATPKTSARESHLCKTAFDSSHVVELEEWIDSYTAHLSPLENFILPVLNFVIKQLTL